MTDIDWDALGGANVVKPETDEEGETPITDEDWMRLSEAQDINDAFQKEKEE